MTLTAQDVLTRADDTLQDPEYVHWTEAERLRYLSDGRREIAIVRPDLFALSAVVSLSAGSKQTLPVDAARFLDAVRNIGADGVTPGRAVSVVERETLDAQNPDWHTMTKASAVRHFMFDERAPRVFFVYPPAVDGTKLEVLCAYTPAEITDPATVLGAEDVYLGALVDYVCYRAFNKDAEDAGNAARAQAHYQQFANAIGVGARVGVVVSPNTANIGGTSPRAAAAAG